jgi:hypothetical protein
MPSVRSARDICAAAVMLVFAGSLPAQDAGGSPVTFGHDDLQVTGSPDSAPPGPLADATPPLGHRESILQRSRRA